MRKMDCARVKAKKLAQQIIKYGLSKESYEVLLLKGCAICKGPPNGRGRYHFDHDHKTGVFRGLLCSSCNVAIGLFRDSEQILKSAIVYLNNSEGK